MKYASIPLLLLLCSAAGAGDEVKDFPRVPPVEPANVAPTFKTQGGFRMDLIAAEPLITDPVAMAYDENGRAYVAEMNDYPYTNKKTHQPWKDNTTDAPIGRIRLLEDTDGDGVFDKSSVFAEGLSWPTAIACWKGGIFVGATPDVWYMKDTDGDGKADVRRKVFTGFRKFNVQAVMNNLIWGLDNKIYGAGAGNGGSVIHAGQIGEKPVTLSRHDFRFDPATEQFEAIPGGARFGNTFDDWGNRFVCNIRNPAQHIILENRYLARNPYLMVSSAVHDVAESGDALPVYRISQPEAWRDFRARRWAGEARTDMPRSELVAGGVVTSASGITVYRGGAYPPEFKQQFFIGEPANNLVHRQALVTDGVTFTSHRIEKNVDFVASTDIWFRAVNFVNAPDGTLHVLDMYREVIEHPWSIPEDILEKLDLESGRDRGRIYRLAPPGFVAPKPPRLGGASIEQLVGHLDHPSGWWRDTAQRLLVERQDASAVAALRGLLQRSSNPLGRLHALWTLEGLGATSEQDILRGLGDQSPGVRENAIKIAELHLEKMPALLDRLLQLADDAEVRARFQAVLTLGQSGDSRIAQALVSAARRDAADPWLRIAVLSSASPWAQQILSQLMKDQELGATAPGREMLRQLALLVGARGQMPTLREVLRAMPAQGAAAGGIRTTVVGGLGEGLRRQRRTLRQVAPDPTSPDGKIVHDVITGAYATAASDKAPLDERQEAIRLIAADEPAKATPILAELLDGRQPHEVQRAAVAALTALNPPDLPKVLIDHWRACSPAVRGDVIQAMLGYKNRLLPLFDAIEAGKIPARDIPASRRALLLKHSDEQIRTRAEKLFAEAAGARKEVIQQYQAALSLKGDPARGQKIYETTCMTCHRVGNQGFEVGPNLATVRQWSDQQLLTNILDPSREIAPNYLEYVIELEEGETVSGVIVDETPSSVTLRWSGGTQQVIPRSEIRRMAASRISLMPEGLESAINLQQMADLLSFIHLAH